MKRWLTLGLVLVSGSVVGQELGQPGPGSDPNTRGEIAQKSFEDQAKFQTEQFKHILAELKIQGEQLRLDSLRSRHDLFPKFFGFDFVEADPVLRSQLSLPDDEGLVVVSVTAGGMADQAGIKDKDLIIKINSQPVADVAKAQNLLVKPGNPTIDLYRAGKPVQISLTMPKRATYWIGVPVNPVDATLRSQLPALPAEAGLIVTDVVADSPAAKAGVQKNDILIRTEDDLLTSNEVLIDRIQKSAGKEIKLDLLRAGKIVTVNVTPVKRAAAEANFLPEYMNRLMRAPSGPIHSYHQVKPNSLGYEPAGDYLWFSTTPFKTDDIVRNPHKVNSVDRSNAHGPIFPPGFGRNWPTSPNIVPISPGIGATNARLEAEMNELTAKIEELRRAIDSMKSQKPADATPDK